MRPPNGIAVRVGLKVISLDENPSPFARENELLQNLHR